MTTWQKSESVIYEYTGQLPAGLDRVYLEQKNRTRAGNPVFRVILQRGSSVQLLEVKHYRSAYPRTCWTLEWARKNAENYIKELFNHDNTSHIS